MKDWLEVPLVDVGAEHALDGFHVGETVGGLDEFAEEVLTVADGVGCFLHFQVVGVDLGTVGDVGEDAGPFRAFVVPDVVEEAGLAARGGHEPDLAVGSRDGAAYGPIDAVLHEGSFVDDEDVGGVADAGVAAVGDGDDVAAVGELDGIFEAHDAAEADVEAAGIDAGFVDENRGLVLGSREDHDGLVGRGEGVVEGLDGNRRGLSPLAVAAYDEVLGVCIEDFGLLDFGLEVEGGFGPFAGCCGTAP